jgi:hypothetical protein
VIAPTILGLERTKATQGWHQEKRGAVMLGEGIPAGMPYTFEDAESVDAAIADALKSQKNRQTVLRFEEDVVDFVQSSTGEAYHFPLSLSGYQRLLAHRIAQYHGLQTSTVDDGGDEHGKIKATKPHSGLEPRKVCAPKPYEEISPQPRLILPYRLLPHPEPQTSAKL